MKNPLRFAVAILVLAGCASTSKQLELEHIKKQQVIAARYMAGEIDRHQAEIMATLTQAEYETRLGKKLGVSMTTPQQNILQSSEEKSDYQRGVEARRSHEAFSQGWDSYQVDKAAHDPNRPSLDEIFNQVEKNR